MLVASTFDGDKYVVDALRAGASGFLLKDTPPDQLFHVSPWSPAGDALLAPAVALRLIDRFVPVEAVVRRVEGPAALPQLTWLVLAEAGVLIRDGARFPANVCMKTVGRTPTR